MPARWSWADERVRRPSDALDFRHPGLPKPPRGKRAKDGGGEPVPVKPNRPRQGEGGAAAALEFDGP